MERGGEDRQVPHGRRFLRLQAATTGKIFALVSSADKHRNPTGTDPDV
jgi:hypothetical protein